MKSLESQPVTSARGAPNSSSTALRAVKGWQTGRRPVPRFGVPVLLLFALPVLVAVAASVAAQKPDQATPPPKPAELRVYQPAGAPADPKVPARWNFYRDYAQATALLKQIAAAHPKICRLETLGKSHGGREMWVISLTNFETLDADLELDRPAFWIDGGIHANEVQSVDTVLYTAWFLAESYGRQETVTRLLDERVFYLLPMMSPDSRDVHMYRPNTTNSPRGGQRPVDDDRDGRVDEDPVDDLDGDGHITRMRIRDPNGRYKPHPDYPQLMIRCDPDERGEYRLLGSEGIDNDGDGLVNEDGDGYYDPNRDWAWQWQPRYVQNGSFKYPFSVLENRMMADFVLAHPNIAGAQTYHNTGGMILRGPGVAGEKWPAADLAVYDLLGKRGEMMLPGYRYINSAEDLYEVYGGEDDWFFVMRGVFAFTNELNTSFNLFREKSEDRGFFGRREDQYKFDKYLLFGDGYVDWHKVDHPQYGKIEVGGKKKNWGRQPPSFMLEEECHRNMAFTLFHADQMPLVEIDAVTRREIENGLVEVTATIVNRKLIPTHAAIDRQNKVTPANRVLIAGKDVTVVTALTSDDMFFKDADVVRRNPSDVRIQNIRSMRPVYVRWIVRGKGPFTVTVRSPKGGVVTRVSE